MFTCVECAAMPRCFLAAKLKYPYVKWKEGQEVEGSADAPRGGDSVAPILWRLDVPASLDRIQEHNVDVVGREEEVEDEEEEQREVDEPEEPRRQEEEEEEEEEERAWWNRGGVRREGWTKISMTVSSWSL
jgi:hypothetical protein